MKTCDLTTNDCVCAPEQALPAKNLQIVIPVTDGLGRFWQLGNQIVEPAMKKIALILALAFAISTGITIMTVIADMDVAMADCGSTNC